MAKLTLKGKVNTNSEIVRGQTAPDFTLVDSDLNDILASYEGKNKVLRSSKFRHTCMSKINTHI